MFDLDTMIATALAKPEPEITRQPFDRRDMSVVFLDVDGVMATPRCFATGARARHAQNKVNRWHVYGWDEACVQRLNRLTEMTDAVIVVSSTWRRGARAPGMREICKAEGVVAPVVDITPTLDKQERGHEIQQWLNYASERGWNIRSFVILDDDADMGELLPHLVQTNPDEGLQDPDVERAATMLNQHREPQCLPL